MVKVMVITSNCCKSMSSGISIIRILSGARSMVCSARNEVCLDVRKQLAQIMQKISKGSLEVQEGHRHRESKKSYKNLRKALAVGYANQLAERSLSATGTISNVAIRQPGFSNGATFSYEGRFEILSFMGSYVANDSSARTTIGGLNVSLAGADGCVIEGAVAGGLTPKSCYPDSSKV